MENMTSKISAKSRAVGAGLRDAYLRQNNVSKALLQITLVFGAVLLPEAAYAASAGGANTQFLCYIAKYFKEICGTCALVVIGMWAIEHLFGVSKLHDMVIKVGVAAAVVIGGSGLISNSGLSSACVM